ncbi:hypothetical protein JMUB7552_27180 [Staphylococcus aureus]
MCIRDRLEIPKSRKVHSDGIHFQGFRYSNTNLAAYVGEYVLIRYNPNDMAEIRVFYRDEFLCTAICPEIADYSIDIKDIQHARSCLLYTSPSPRDTERSRMPSSA